MVLSDGEVLSGQATDFYKRTPTKKTFLVLVQWRCDSRSDTGPAACWMARYMVCYMAHCMIRYLAHCMVRYVAHCKALRMSLERIQATYRRTLAIFSEESSGHL